VGDQFGKTNGHLLSKIFAWFYFAINFGAFLSQIMTPVLLDRYGPHVAFGVPGGLMLLATFVFWLGRSQFVHIPAGGMGFIKETFSKTGLKIIGRLCVIYIFVAMFWALFDQSSSAWVLQADKMDRNLLGLEWLPSQIGAINPVMIMTFIPIFTWLIYPALNRVFPLTPLRKIAIGFFVAVPSFLIPAWIETQIAGGELPNIIWQIAAYVVLTAAEVFISITALEFSYTQAPQKMKSLILGFFLMSVSLGNLFTAGVNHFIQNPAPSFTPDVEGTYVLAFKANDGKASSVTNVTIHVLQPKEEEAAPPATANAKSLPTANAGHLRAVPAGKLARLYGTASKGDYNGAFDYAWTFAAVPEGSALNNAALAKANTRNPNFTPDVDGAYDLQFVVKVGDAAEAVATNSVTVQATAENLPPVMMVDSNQTRPPNQAIALSGADTFDPNGDALTYEWSFVSRAEGSALTAESISGSQFSGPTSKLTGATYYLLFAGLMLLAALVFIPVAMAYKPKEYLQDEAESGETEVDSDN
jgi:POT family proton-dependent oligopeptide transporter